MEEQEDSPSPPHRTESLANGWYWLVAWLAWIAAIAASSHFPSSAYPPSPWAEADKVVHAGGYFVMGVLGVGALARLRPNWPRPLWGTATLLVGALFGALDEYHQSFIPGRSMALDDWATDLLGLAIAVILARLVQGRLARIWMQFPPSHRSPRPR